MLKFNKTTDTLLHFLNNLLHFLNNLPAWRFIAVLTAFITCLALVMLPEILSAST